LHRGVGDIGARRRERRLGRAYARICGFKLRFRGVEIRLRDELSVQKVLGPVEAQIRFAGQRASAFELSFGLSLGSSRGSPSRFWRWLLSLSWASRRRRF